MAIKAYKPTSPGRRSMTVSDYSDLTSKRRIKKLTSKIKSNAGRNSQGRISIRHRGGGSKKIYRIIDFKRDKFEIPAVVSSIEYDPYRTSRLALLNYKDGEKRYILAPDGLEVGDTIISSDNAEIKVGNSLKLRFIPDGSMIHNIELNPGNGAKLARSAGNFAQIMAKESEYAQLKLSSGEIRLVRIDCRATIGRVGNTDHELIVLGKAGRKRHMGKRPKVRGVAMNPVDHPHGGGEGKAAKGNPHPVSPWGWITIGRKTRNNKSTDKYIVKRRRVGYGMD